MSDPRLDNTVTLEVLRTKSVVPHIVEVFLGGEQFPRVEVSPHADRYIKLVFRRDEGQKPVKRTYTIRQHDRDAGEISILFVTHGADGYAAPWARNAKPGDKLEMFSSSGGAYTPDTSADWHLFAGDEAAYPAIVNALQTLPASAKVRAIIEIEGDELPLETKADLNVQWVSRGDSIPGEPLMNAVTGASFPEGDVHAFVHGELAAIRFLKKHLLNERGIAPERLSISGYWRHGKTEDGFQAEKRAERATGKSASRMLNQSY